MKEKRILIVDDELNLAAQLAENFAECGFHSKFITNPDLIFSEIIDFAPDAIVLDKMMPQRNGVDVLKDIRSSEAYCTIPIIMLTASSSKSDLLQAYNSGIDDFIVKPFDFDELRVRVSALCNRVNRTKSLLKSGNISLCTKSCSVTVDNVTIELTLTEFNLLKTLMNHKNEVLRRGQLSRDVLGKNLQSSRSLDVHVFSLRNKLNDNSDIIKTIRGVGYKFCA